jgi:hypothetical protein
MSYLKRTTQPIRHDCDSIAVSRTSGAGIADMTLLILLVTLLVPGLVAAQTLDAPVYKIGNEW